MVVWRARPHSFSMMVARSCSFAGSGSFVSRNAYSPRDHAIVCSRMAGICVLLSISANCAHGASAKELVVGLLLCSLRSRFVVSL